MASPDWQAEELTQPVPNSVMVWRVPMETHRPLDDAEWNLLHPDERARAERFKFEEPRIRLVRCRRALRILLGRWLRCDPAGLQFLYGDYGKPELTGIADAPAFNVSHSHDWGLIAIADTGALGIDVERMDPRTTWPGLARRFYSPREVATLEALATEQQLAGFYRIWTGKESFIKAIGRGLSFPLASFSVQGDPALPPQLLAVDNDAQAPQCWRMQTVSPADGYAATVLWNGSANVVRCHDFIAPVT